MYTSLPIRQPRPTFAPSRICAQCHTAVPEPIEASGETSAVGCICGLAMPGGCPTRLIYVLYGSICRTIGRPLVHQADEKTNDVRGYPDQRNDDEGVLRFEPERWNVRCSNLLRVHLDRLVTNGT